MSKERFEALMNDISLAFVDHDLDDALKAHLNRQWPVGGEVFNVLRAICDQGERQGWPINHEAGGIKFERAIKTGTSAGHFSVDVVRMKGVRGPRHMHPNGEIGAVLALEGTPKLDTFEEGWYVYGLGSHHHPTVAGGDAYVLYLPPEGAIDFTGR